MSSPRTRDLPLVGAEDPTLRIELRHGIQHEGALTASDLVDRRTRLGLIDGQRPPRARGGRADALNRRRFTTQP